MLKVVEWGYGEENYSPVGGLSITTECSYDFGGELTAEMSGGMFNQNKRGRNLNL